MYLIKNSDKPTKCLPVISGAIRRPTDKNRAAFSLWQTGFRLAHISLETLRHEMVSKKIIATPGLLSLIKQEDLKPVIGLEQHSFTKITVSDLGLPDGSTLKMIYTKALAVGLNLCPSWVSYDLWIQNPGLLALDEACLVAMTPLIEPAGSLKVHQLWNDFGIKKIGIYHANPDTKYGKNCAWIFVLPSTKKSLL